MTSFYSKHAELYMQHYSRLFHVLRKITGDTQLAEELVQEVFIRLIRFYPTITDTSHSKGLLNTITRTVVQDEYRKQQARIQPMPLMEECFDLPTQEDPAVYCTDKVFAERILSKLAPNYRMIMLMLMEHCPYAEIATQLGTTPNNVKMMIHRAREAAWEHYQRAMEMDAA